MTDPPRSLPVAATLSILLATLLAALTAGCVEVGDARDGGDEKAHPTSLLLVTIDTLRADHLGVYGYFRDTSPVLDAFAEESILFETCLTPIATTLPAHTSLMTAAHPLEHGILENLSRLGERSYVQGTSLRSFAEVARERGLRTAAFVSAVAVGHHTGLPRGFEVYDAPERAQRPANRTNERLLPWLDRFGSEPFFLWVHYYDPHFPYKPPDGFDLFGDDARLESYVRERKVPETATRPNQKALATRPAINGYDGDVRFVDFQLGRLFEKLRRLGLWEEIAIVVTSDHGEGLGEHDMVGHGYVHREQLQVPLMIRVPGGEARRVKRPVSLVDVLPTVLGLIGESGWESFLAQASGRDVLESGLERDGILGRRSDRKREDVTGPVLAFTDGRWSYIHEPDDRGDRLFDWADDPHELEDVRRAQPEIAAKMKASLRRAAGELTDRGRLLATREPTSKPPLEPEVVEQLEALGYID